MARKNASSKTQAPEQSGTKRKVDWSALETFDGFTVTSLNVKPQRRRASKRSKTSGHEEGVRHVFPGYDAPLDARVIQANPFEEANLSEVHMKIEPALHWESTNRYRKFTINTEEFEVGQTVFVNKADDPNQVGDNPDIKYWLARVLEIRAGDPSHVFLRVFWAYRPEDLPGGRQPYHGSGELIISNHGDVIDALTVHASAHVVHWDGNPEKVSALASDQLFWRQSLDITKKVKQLSKLTTYCIDQAPCNPDEPMVQCPHCAEWLHAHCLEERVAQDASERAEHVQVQKPKKQGRSNKADIALFEAKLDVSDPNRTRLTITDRRKGQGDRQWDVDIPCLMCGEMIEQAEEDDRLEPHTRTQPSAGNLGAGVLGDAIAVTTSAVVRIPREEVERDFAVRNKRMENKQASYGNTITPGIEPAPMVRAQLLAPRGRGRPIGSTKKRKRNSTIPGERKAPTTLPETRSAKVSAGKATHMPELSKWTVKTEETATANALAPAKNVTPPASPMVNESVFQSGVRSVKRLLWK